MEAKTDAVYDNIPVMKETLSHIFSVDKDSFHSFEYLSDGISNISFRFHFRDNYYIMRFPRDNHNQADKLKQEYEAYGLLEKANVQCTDELIHFDIERGIKITKYICNAYYPDIQKEDNIRRCLVLLRNIHESGINSSKYFDIAQTLIREEMELKFDAECYLVGYKAIRQAFFKIYDNLPKNQNMTFCHIDPIKYNFLLSDSGDYIIDFEYARMCNPLIDLASFAIYNQFNEEQIYNMLQLYYNHPPVEEEQEMIYRYMAMEGLISAVWYLNRIENEKNKTAMYQSYFYAVNYFHKILI